MTIRPSDALSTVGPDFDAVSGSAQFSRIVGALLTYGLLTAVVMIVACATVWALAASSGSWHTASRAKSGLLVALGGATLLGLALAWANWLLGLGASL